MDKVTLIKFTNCNGETVIIDMTESLIRHTVRKEGKIISKLTLSRLVTTDQDIMVEFLKHHKISRVTYIDSENTAKSIIEILKLLFNEKQSMKTLHNYTKIFNYKVNKHILTNEEIGALNKVARRTGMDCWFHLRLNGNNEWIVYDLEERKRLTLSTGIKYLSEGLGKVVTWGLNIEETLALATVLSRFGVRIQ